MFHTKSLIIGKLLLRNHTIVREIGWSACEASLTSARWTGWGTRTTTPKSYEPASANYLLSALPEALKTFYVTPRGDPFRASLGHRGVCWFPRAWRLIKISTRLLLSSSDRDVSTRVKSTLAVISNSRKNHRTLSRTRTRKVI